MAMYEDFIHSLLPGNYALTKSMELTRVTTSGTLWYTKKYLVLYYYVFLSNDIFNTSYVEKVTAAFDNYVLSLDEEIRESARTFFFPEDERINFHSPHFKTFVDFANRTHFHSDSERTSYYNDARKCYFAFLMGTGGQAGVKQLVVNAVKRQDFHYDYPIMQELIFNSAINVCVEKANNNENINSGDVPRILSQTAIEKIKGKANIGVVTEEDARIIANRYPCSNEFKGRYGSNSFTSPQYSGVESDCFASIRNDRQILYYYGFFHSKSSGATEFEFSSLTPIGELALNANAIEFLTIWEHQKIKMISQPATADINQVVAVDNPPEQFGISYTPYTDILGHLIRRDSLSLDEYKYIVSRKKHCFVEEAWEQGESEIINNLVNIKTYVNNFGRKSDCTDFDGRKELLKYLLGIRGDLPKDNHHNPLSVVDFRNATAHVTNLNALAMLYGTYSKIDDYKVKKYEQVYNDSEEDLRRRYLATLNGDDSPINSRVKIYWDLYNIHPDNFIMISIASTISAISLGIETVETMSTDDVNRVSAFIYTEYRELFKALGMRSQTAIKREVQKVLNSLRSEDYEPFMNVEGEHEEQTIARYRTENAADLRERIERISAIATVSPAENRERNATLVSLLKSYYMSRFAENNMLKCECCGEETFITNAGEPYVEFHHLIPFSIAYGPDHYLNLFALCPNCHRKIHFLSTEDKQSQYEDLSENNYLHLCFTERLRELKAQNLLRSYHLEYLLVDNAITIEEYNSIAA